MAPPSPLDTLCGAAAVAMTAVLFGAAPARLLAEDRKESDGRVGPRAVSLIAMASGLIAYALALIWTGWTTATTFGAASACLAAMAVIDFDRLLIPDLYAVALLALALVGPLARPALPVVFGAFTGFGLLFVVREAFRRVRGVEAMGFGDVKLLGAVGALAGAEAVLWIITAAAFIGLAWALVRSRTSAGAPMIVPFGAAAALPAWAAVALRLAHR